MPILCMSASSLEMDVPAKGLPSSATLYAQYNSFACVGMGDERLEKATRQISIGQWAACAMRQVRLDGHILSTISVLCGEGGNRLTGHPRTSVSVVTLE